MKNIVSRYRLLRFNRHPRTWSKGGSCSFIKLIFPADQRINWSSRVPFTLASFAIQREVNSLLEFSTPYHHTRNPLTPIDRRLSLSLTWSSKGWTIVSVTEVHTASGRSSLDDQRCVDWSKIEATFDQYFPPCSIMTKLRPLSLSR